MVNEIYKEYETALNEFLATGDMDAFFKASTLSIAIGLERDLDAASSSLDEGQNEAA